MGSLLENWLCPDCFKSPHSYKEVAPSSSKIDCVENRAVREIIREELQLFAPKLTKSLNDVINGSTEKTVNKAVHLYSEVTAKSQKKVIEDLSTAQASENVISKVQTKMHTDAYERNLRKLNLCVVKVPESNKATSKQRQEDDAKFCLETLKIEKRDFISCHRAGKPDPNKPDYCRPLIIKTADEESVNYYSNHGKVAAHGNWATVLELESVQRRFTRLIDEVGTLPYSRRLEILNLTTLAEQRIRGDLIEAFKATSGLTDYGSGILMDGKLCWKPHIDALNRKLKSACGLIYGRGTLAMESISEH
ncbi:hypothetical protein ACHWQZ_G015001 [Mnemiopsis leidyi]